MRGFRVIDKKTGEYPDLEKIALEEDWAKGLIYCDMEGFALLEDGNLILLDECGNFAYCPFDRFEVVLETSDNICPADADDHSDEMQSDIRDYCERYEPTYNPEDGSM